LVAEWVGVSVSHLLNLPQDITEGKAGKPEDSKASASNFFKRSKLHMRMLEWRVDGYCATEA